MRDRKIKIGTSWIGQGCPPWIIAEMSGNHNHSLKRALRIVEAAAKAGCHALKLQTYTADTMTIRSSRKDFFIHDKTSLWKGKSLYQLYKEAYTPWEWHAKIFKRCSELGIIGFSTPFDESAVDFLQGLEVPVYKIGSFENTDLPLLHKVAATGKPIILSTGMATIQELQDAVNMVRKAGNEQLVLLKCTSAYPGLPEECHLRTIPDMREKFKVLAGLSDHTLGIGVAVASVVFGACVIEKHFTLSRKEGGVDSAFSMEPMEMKRLVTECKNAYGALGKVHYGPTKREIRSLQFRRSVYVIEDIRAGEAFTPKNLGIIRPGSGLAPKYYEKVLGRKAKKTVTRGTPLSWKLVAGCNGV